MRQLQQDQAKLKAKSLNAPQDLTIDGIGVTLG